MNCPRCGKENPEDAQLCQFCSCALTQSTVTAESIIIKTSGLAIASMVLGILSVLTCGITAIPAVIFGIISLVQIEKSGGRLTGRGFAIVGIVVPVLSLIIQIVIFIPALNRAREQGRRAVCLGNLKQLSLAWVMYSDENDGKLVNGESGDAPREKVDTAANKTYLELPWAFETDPGTAINVQEAQIAQGALWPYSKNAKVYRCPDGKARHARTYSIPNPLNGQPFNNTNAFYWVKHRSLIRRPHDRIVFVDEGRTFMNTGNPQTMNQTTGYNTGHSFKIYYNKNKWMDPPPVQHGGGVTVSFGDAHSEYWKWKGQDTIGFGRNDKRSDGDRQPTSPEGKEDLQKVQKAVWGELGYTPSVSE